MSAYLRQAILDQATELPISDEQFDAIAKARITLTSAFALEESYDLLIGNYVEVEQELLAATAIKVVRNLHKYHDFFELRSTINRRVVNLLTSTRLYLNQTPQRLSNCAAEPQKARTEFIQETKSHYDAHFGYRFLEALRNYVQHCGLAVHKVSINRKWVGEGENQEIEISIQPFTERHYLVADDKFKKKILDEMPEQVVLTLAIRQYLQCIGNLHKLVRSHIAEQVAAARQTIEEQITRYSQENNGSTHGLAAFKTDSQGREQSIPLLLDWDDVRIKLVERNSHMVALERHVVTGRIIQTR